MKCIMICRSQSLSGGNSNFLTAGADTSAIEMKLYENSNSVHTCLFFQGHCALLLGKLCFFFFFGGENVHMSV